MRTILVAALVATLAACVQMPQLNTSPWAHVPVVDVGKSHGSGVVVAKDRVLTAAHVVDAAKGPIRVQFDDYSAPAVALRGGKATTDTDWSLLLTETPDDVEPVETNCAEPELGDEVWHVGYPNRKTKKVIHGYVSSLDVGEGLPIFHNTVALDLGSGGGSSGGPVFDSQGRLIGLLVGAAIYRSGDGFASAITGNYALMVRLPDEVC